MKKVIIIGGGLAGMSSAVYLADAGYKVKIIEASPKLGGRTYSFFHNGIEIDNGQHILLNCYDYALDYLHKIGAQDEFEKQERLEIDFKSADNGIFSIKTASNLPYPMSYLKALWNFDLFSIKDKIKLIGLFVKLFTGLDKKSDSDNALDWLTQNGQSLNLINNFWYLFLISIFNSNLDKIDVKILKDVLKQAFRNKHSADIVFPKSGLSKLFYDNAVKFVKDRNGEVFLSERVSKIEMEKNSVVRIETSKNYHDDFDYVISAVPPYAINRLFEERIIDENIFTYSTILNVHLMLKNNILKQKMYALVGSKVHWIFGKEKLLSLTISAADDLTKLDSSELLAVICSELEKYFSDFDRNLITDYKIIKEKRATFISDKKTTNFRKKLDIRYENLFFAGDWTCTKLPSTIESAVKSGYLAAKNIF